MNKEVFSPKNWLKYIALLLLFAILYVICGAIGIALALQQITPIWIPSGIGVAILFWFGYKYCPFIFIGSFLINIYGFHSPHHFFSFLVVAQMALGATLEAVVATYFLKRFAPRFEDFSQIYDVVIFIFLAGLISPFISATNGVSAMKLGGLVTWSGFFKTWLSWWLGDAIGIIVFTPFILFWLQKPKFYFRPTRLIEVVLLFVTVAIIGYIAFSGYLPLEYLFIPCLLWAVFRFGLFGAITITIIIAVIAIVGTINGYGVFAREVRVESLWILQSFIGVIAISTLMLGAVLAERDQRTNDLLAAISETQKARIEAETANQTKSIFLANMSHELHTPLNHIIGYCGLLQDELIEKQQTTAISDLKKIDLSAKHLLALISDILDISEIETGKTELRITSFELSILLDKLYKIISELADKNKNTLEFDIQADIGPMISDKAKIYRILFNILENACKFTSRGKIFLKIFRDKDWIIFRITDTGIGMSKEQVDQAFQPFVRIESPYFGGTGLGLAIAKSFTRMLGGEIHLSSQLDQGTTFTIRLPRKSRIPTETIGRYF